MQPFVTLGRTRRAVERQPHRPPLDACGDHWFISSHVVISGFCDIGESLLLRRQLDGREQRHGRRGLPDRQRCPGRARRAGRQPPEGPDDAPGGGEHVGEARPSGAVRPVASRVAVTPYEPAQAAAWDAFVERSPNGLMLFRRGYMDYHADRFTDASLWLSEDGRPVAVLPASRDGDTVVSHGGLTFGGLVLAPETRLATVVEAVAALRDHARAAGLRSLVVQADAGVPVRPAGEPRRLRAAPRRRHVAAGGAEPGRRPRVPPAAAGAPRALGPPRAAPRGRGAAERRPGGVLADPRARAGATRRASRPLGRGDRAAALAFPRRDHAPSRVPGRRDGRGLGAVPLRARAPQPVQRRRRRRPRRRRARPGVHVAAGRAGAAAAVAELRHLERAGRCRC